MYSSKLYTKSNYKSSIASPSLFFFFTYFNTHENCFDNRIQKNTKELKNLKNLKKECRTNKPNRLIQELLSNLNLR